MSDTIHVNGYISPWIWDNFDEPKVVHWGEREIPGHCQYDEEGNRCIVMDVPLDSDLFGNLITPIADDFKPKLYLSSMTVMPTVEEQKMSQINNIKTYTNGKPSELGYILMKVDSVTGNQIKDDGLFYSYLNRLN